MSARDRIFDGLTDKFADSLYGKPRGELRLALLDELLPRTLTLCGQPALDVGGGLGQMSAWLARRGHPVTLAEPSGEMLERARDAHGGLPIEFRQLPLQALDEAVPGPWPLIVCHAVLEWLAEPRQALATLSRLLAPGGQLSLMVFNRDALRFSNVVKGNLQKALDDRLAGTGQRQRLTPISPLTHAEISGWLAEAGLVVEHVAGIRVFHDYLREREPDAATLARLFELERRYCDVEPHWRLGRYLLYHLRKPAPPWRWEMSATTPVCQLIERQADACRQFNDYRGWLWVAPPSDPWLTAQAPGPLWSADLTLVRQWRAVGLTAYDSLEPEIATPPGAVLFWPKAHALGEWWLLALCRGLPAGTPLQIVGENQGGIKRVLKVLAALGLGCRKLDSARRCTLFETRVGPLALDPDALWQRFEAAGLTLASHPGVFGHGKLDDGTRLLLEHLPHELGRHGERVLDVGCGDGVIAASLAQRGAAVTALDVSAFAVEATRRTLAANALQGTVVQSDVYDGLADDGRFSAIVSNPPFHQERAIDYGPAARLIAEAPERLERGGSLLLVANAFLPYPDRLEAAFGRFSILADDRRFRVYRAIRR